MAHQFLKEILFGGRPEPHFRAAKRTTLFREHEFDCRFPVRAPPRIHYSLTRRKKTGPEKQAGRVRKTNPPPYCKRCHKRGGGMNLFSRFPTSEIPGFLPRRFPPHLFPNYQRISVVNGAGATTPTMLLRPHDSVLVNLHLWDWGNSTPHAFPGF